jgi:hypothetical protein
MNSVETNNTGSKRKLNKSDESPLNRIGKGELKNLN